MKKCLTLLIAMLALAGTLAQAQIVKKEGAFRCGGWNDDFRQLRDLHWNMEELDMSLADCDSIRQNALHSRHRLKKIVFPDKLRIIGSQALFACDSIESLILPAGTERIESRAFGNCTGLKTLTVLAPTPPLLAEDAFSGVDVSKIRLVVPKGSKKAYKSAPNWDRFFKKPRTVAEQCPDEYAIIPVPNRIVYHSGKTLSTKSLGKIIAPASLVNEQERLKEVLGHRLGIKNFNKGKCPITLGIDNKIGGKEAYRLVIDEDGISITGADATGVFYGIMTLDQMLVPEQEGGRLAYLNAVTVEDSPRTGMRELMVDPCRIFIPFEDLKGMVVEMARYKMNALHLHLTDDQAWRIEIKKNPRLTELGSFRVGMDDMQMPIGGFYTQEQMKELVVFASQYHVEIIPEIEMPGHQVAAIHCYPELTCGAVQLPIRTTCGVSDNLLCPSNEFTYEFLENVFTELSSVFTSKYVHLGGDEAGNPPLECWSGCESCQALLKDIMSSPDTKPKPGSRNDNWRLQKYMFDRVIDFLHRKLDKTPMFWYETDFHEIQPGCIVFAWRHGLTATAIDAAIRCNAKIMLCPGEHCYLDYPAAKGDMPEVNWGMPVTSLAQTYRLDPAWGYGKDFEANNLFGVAGTLWSECINSTERLYYMAFPRALALSEAGWSRQENRDYQDFLKRLARISRDMHHRGICTANP
ncbi:MAG: family 20 glycosylhydrolase [Bacteroidaceae bacterium]|nr:family 20 glycosylhydrolase [Bacteroidaceae bacterium]